MEQFFFEKISKNQNNHWWYKSRREIFLKILKQLKLKNPKILDYGSGAGANIELLKKLSQNIDAFEPNTSMHLKLKSNGANIIKKIDKKYDLIVLTDVIEHVKNDRELLSSITDRLNSKGFIFITAPAY